MNRKLTPEETELRRDVLAMLFSRVGMIGGPAYDKVEDAIADAEKIVAFVEGNTSEKEDE
jgi:hypothetical protein